MEMLLVISGNLSGVRYSVMERMCCLLRAQALIRELTPSFAHPKRHELYEQLVLGWHILVAPGQAFLMIRSVRGQLEDNIHFSHDRLARKNLQQFFRAQLFNNVVLEQSCKIGFPRLSLESIVQARHDSFRIRGPHVIRHAFLRDTLEMFLHRKPVDTGTVNAEPCRCPLEVIFGSRPRCDLE